MLIIVQSGYWHKCFEIGNGLSIQGFYVTHATSKAGFLGINLLVPKPFMLTMVEQSGRTNIL